MPRHDKLSPDKKADVKFILIFTVGFVVVASVLLIAGYAALSVTGLLSINATDAEPAPGEPTAKPTWSFVGVTPDPEGPVTPAPTWAPKVTPTPTPVPLPYKVMTEIDETEAGNMIYYVSFRLSPDSQPLDMSRTTLKISAGDMIFCDYGYKDACDMLNGVWSNDNGDNRLDPIGEKITFCVNYIALNAPLTADTKMTISLDGMPVVIANIPAPQTPRS